MKKFGLWTGLIFGVALLVIQLIPVDRSNPPVQDEIAAPADVAELLRRSCYDCHSNETVWPWYSRIAPVSWLVVSDVHEGREHLNFSTWKRLEAEEQADLVEAVWEAAVEGEMPLWFYLPLHPDARLTDNDLAILRRWSQAVEGAHVDEDQH